MRTSKGILERMMAHVVITAGPLDTPCWISTYALTPKGYTKMTVSGGRRFTHRVSYELHVGPIPDGWLTDHLCRVRACCNPAHLEAVTPLENTRRGISPNNIAHLTNTCKRGHSMLDAWVRHASSRQCRECNRMRSREVAERRRHRRAA